MRLVLPGREQADAVGARHGRLQLGGDRVQRDALVDVLDHREHGPHSERERGHDPQRAQAHRGRREAFGAMRQRHHFPVCSEQLDLLDLRGQAAEVAPRAVRGCRAGAGHADMRQRGEVVERPPGLMQPWAEIPVGPAAAHPSAAAGAVHVEAARHPREVDQHAYGVGHAVERMGGSHGPYTAMAVQSLPQFVHAPRPVQVPRLEADISGPIGDHGSHP